VRCVVSTLAGDARDAMLARKRKPQEETVTGLTAPEIRELVERYLREIRHQFPNLQVEQAFYGKLEKGNPLYILVALEELRVFGKFEALARRVEDLPDSVPALFDQVLERIEGDFNQPLVRDCMSCIACGRHGMTAEELQTLLKAHAPRIDPSIDAQKFPDMLWARLYRSFSSYLFERSGVIDFFHAQLKEAVGKRYLEKERDREVAHKAIANYFESRWKEPYLRALEELPHQLTKATDWEGMEHILCDLAFVETKCAAGLTYDLIADYGPSELETAPLIRTPCRNNGLYGTQCPCCLAWSGIDERILGQTIDCPACKTRLSINPFSLNSPWRLSPPRRSISPLESDRKGSYSTGIREYADFVRQQAHILSSRPWLTFQQAANLPDSAHPARKAKSLWEAGLEQRIWIDWLNKPQRNDPCVIRFAKGPSPSHTLYCVFCQDGRRFSDS